MKNLILMALFLPYSAFAIFGGELLAKSSRREVRSLHKYTVRLIVTRTVSLRGFNFSEQEICTGTIIGKKTVLLADHCVRGISGIKAQFFDETDEVVKEIKDLDIAYKGISKFAEISLSEKNGEISIDKWPKSQVDIALLKLSTEIPAGFLQAKVDLHTSEKDLKEKDLFKIGFGRSDRGRERKVGRFILNGVKDGVLISWPKSDIDGAICFGDSGGGVVYFENEEPTVVAVNSAGIGLDIIGKKREICRHSVAAEIAISLSAHKNWFLKNYSDFEEN